MKRSRDILDRKLVRDLAANKGTLIAVISIIALGTGCLTGIVGTYQNLVSARDRFYAQCHLADFWVDVRESPNDLAARAAAVPGIARVSTRIAKPVVLDLPGVRAPLGSIAISLPPDQAGAINGVVLRTGSWFSSARAEEVLVSEKFASARGLVPGSVVHLLAGGAKRAFRVCGTVLAAEFVYLAAPGSIADSPGEYGVFYLPEEVAGQVFGMEGGFNQLVGEFDGGGLAAPGSVLANLEQVLDSAGVITAFPRAQLFSNLTLGSDLVGLQTMAVIFPVVFFGVAALVLNVLMMRLAEQQRSTIGTLKALGHTNRALFAHYIKFGATAGLIGGGLGAGLGGWIADGFTDDYEIFYIFPEMAKGFYPWWKIGGILAAAAVAVAGSVRGVRRVAGMSPAEAMHAPPPAFSGPVFLERFPWLWRRLDFRWQMVLRSTLRNRGRTAVAIGSSALGSAMVILAFGSLDSMNGMIRFQFARVVCSDYHLQLSAPRGGDALLEARSLPGVTAAEPALELAGTFSADAGSKRAALTALDAGSVLTRIVNANGRPVSLPRSGILVSSWLAGKLGLITGDLVNFTPVRGVRRTYPLRVAGIFDSLFGMPVYADRAFVADVMGTGDALTRIDLRGATGGSLQTELFDAVKELPAVESLGRVENDRTAIQVQINAALGSMAIAMIAFAAVIYFGSILNGALIALSERKREIATFRVLGYSPGETGAVFLRENLLTTLPGAVLGLPLGWLLVLGMVAGYANDSFRIPACISPASVVWTLILSLLFALGAHAVVHGAILKLQWQEALSMKE
jgi:putative ABC transport system permease protein